LTVPFGPAGAFRKLGSEPDRPHPALLEQAEQTPDGIDPAPIAHDTLPDQDETLIARWM
jgi:hypothetical protein